MPPAAPTNAKQHALETVTFAHALIDKMLASFPADKMFFQPSPTSNHAVWTMGHLAMTYMWLVTMFDPSKAPALPDSYNGLFGMGSTPSSEPSNYPPHAQVRQHYDACFAAFLRCVEDLKESDLYAPCASESGGFCSCKIDAAMKGAWHDGWHAGQLSDLRRALKLPSIM
jgi:hypothetical protein